ncbi:hypothetical protein M9H77_13369 [Catharanthus roseus]|uniref:Uncharacterized protein n=1 Tax=Catharanthus roseus TaxID=4058 RepID=A0ACC0BK52_CATRO|nr:hypothetical protein M9H77_13369 [Catharanthus roseus]
MNLQYKQQGTCNPKILKFTTGLIGMCLAGYILGPPLFWHLSESVASIGHYSCPPCHCHCNDQPLISLHQDCMKHNPEMGDEMERNFTDLLSEELRMKEAEALENQQHADMALLEAKKMASQFQKEADKCNSGMETCELARERAEEALEAQRDLSAMWELRAKQKGWREGMDLEVLGGIGMIIIFICLQDSDSMIGLFIYQIKIS